MIKSIRPDYKFAMRQYGGDIRFGSSRYNAELHKFFRDNNLPPIYLEDGVAKREQYM